MTLEPTVAYTLRREDFLRCLEEHPGLARRALELLAERLNHLTAFTENLVFLDAPGRVASVLVELAARYGVDEGGIEIGLHLTQSELATWCVVSRVMVNRVLGSFRDEDLIKVERQTITVLDLRGLKRKMTH
jgi:CRP-like cAMP-binding protein